MSSPTVTEACVGNLQHSQCAGFDMDDTLIYGSDGAGYKAYPFAPEKLKELYNSGFNIIVFSNQKKPRQTDKIVDNKIKAVTELYHPIPIHFFCARAEDEYRKPNIGMLKLVPKRYGPLKFFVGDADGSEGAFSDADVEFAKAANVSFFSPEKYFNVYETIDPDNLPVPLRKSKIKFPTLVLLVSFPAGGKTTFCSKIIPHFTRVSRDELKTMPKCLKLTETCLKNGDSVVIDNLNPSVASREEFIKLANKCQAAIVAVHFRVSMSVAQSRNEKRTEKSKVPNLVYYKFRKDFEIPMKAEGIDHIYSYFS